MVGFDKARFQPPPTPFHFPPPTPSDTDMRKLESISAMLRVRTLGPPAPQVTVLEISGADRPHLFLAILTLLRENACDTRSFSAWTFRNRCAFAMEITHRGGPVTDPIKSHHLRDLIRGIMTPPTPSSPSARAAAGPPPIVEINLGSVPVNHERRLHRLMLRESHYEYEEQRKKALSERLRSVNSLPRLSQMRDGGAAGSTSTSSFYYPAPLPSSMNGGNGGGAGVGGRVYPNHTPSPPRHHTKSHQGQHHGHHHHHGHQQQVSPRHSKGGDNISVGGSITPRSGVHHLLDDDHSRNSSCGASSPSHLEWSNHDWTTSSLQRGGLSQYDEALLEGSSHGPGRGEGLIGGYRHEGGSGCRPPGGGGLFGPHAGPQAGGSRDNIHHRPGSSSPLHDDDEGETTEDYVSRGIKPQVDIIEGTSGYWEVLIQCEDRPKLLFDATCTLCDMDYDIYHATVDMVDGVSMLEYYIGPRYGIEAAHGGSAFDPVNAARLRAALIASVQRRFPKGLKLLVDIPDGPGIPALQELLSSLGKANLNITRASTATHLELAGDETGWGEGAAAGGGGDGNGNGKGKGTLGGGDGEERGKSASSPSSSSSTTTTKRHRHALYIMRGDGGFPSRKQVEKALKDVGGMARGGESQLDLESSSHPRTGPLERTGSSGLVRLDEGDERGAPSTDSGGEHQHTASETDGDEDREKYGRPTVETEGKDPNPNHHVVKSVGRGESSLGSSGGGGGTFMFEFCSRRKARQVQVSQQKSGSAVSGGGVGSGGGAGDLVRREDLRLMDLTRFASSQVRLITLTLYISLQPSHPNNLI